MTVVFFAQGLLIALVFLIPLVRLFLDVLLFLQRLQHCDPVFLIMTTVIDWLDALSTLPKAGNLRHIWRLLDGVHVMEHLGLC